MGKDVWQVTDPIGARAYVVVGRRRALLVDTMAGFANPRTAVEAITRLPLTVVLTHRHYDHVAGSYVFGEVAMSAADDGYWDAAAADERLLHDQVCADKGVDPSAPWPLRDGRPPRVTHIGEGQSLDLGGVHVQVVELPGHTPGSLGYLVEEDRILLSGDAVTPIMCLCFPESLPIAAYRRTLCKMAALPFDEFWTGHHGVGFPRASLAGFDRVAAYAEAAPKGIPWVHGYLHHYTGRLYVEDPRSLLDADSPDFRALIVKPVRE